jgi:hypothetical protein
MFMSNQHDGKINFYECLRDLAFSEPYAVLSAQEAESIVKSCDVWVAMIQTHPDLAAMLGEQKASHIEMVIALPNAIRKAKQSRTYPNVLLSEAEYMASMTFLYRRRKAQ